MTAISLRPGTPDDDNRDYLPESLKGSDLVVNENGNNSQPYPVGLEEHTGCVVDDEPDRWYLYVPQSIKPGDAPPLVVSVHGGMMTGWAQAVYTSWTMIADREGFIVLFPDAHARRVWTIEIPDAQLEELTTERPDGMWMNRPPVDIGDNRDVRLVTALVDRLIESHGVDPQRIYMQGMSMGDAMTDQFARYFGIRLAGAAGSGGPTAPALLFDEDGAPRNRSGAVPVWQTRLELDDVSPHYGVPVREVVARHREYWLAVDGIEQTPSISIRGVDNLAFFEGGDAPFVFRDVWNRDHGQTLDDAELVWSFLFSGTRRLEDGRIEITEPRRPRQGDTVSIAVAVGFERAWSDQQVVPIASPAFFWESRKYHGLGGETRTRAVAVLVPVGFIATALGARVTTEPGRARLEWSDGTVVELVRGSVVALVDGDVVAMPVETVERDAVLFVSLEWIARRVLGLRATSHDGVLYVTDHHAELSANMAELIRSLLALPDRRGGPTITTTHTPEDQ